MCIYIYDHLAKSLAEQGVHEDTVFCPVRPPIYINTYAYIHIAAGAPVFRALSVCIPSMRRRRVLQIRRVRRPTSNQLRRH